MSFCLSVSLCFCLSVSLFFRSVLLYVVLSVFRLFYISGANLGAGVVSIHQSFVGWSYVVNAAGYAAGYSAVCLSIAVFLFSRRDFT